MDRLESLAVASHPLRPEDDVGNRRRRRYQAAKPSGSCRDQRVEDNAFHLGYFER